MSPPLPPDIREAIAVVAIAADELADSAAANRRSARAAFRDALATLVGKLLEARQ